VHEQDDIDDAFDADADKQMCLRCAVFALICAPLFVVLDVGMSAPPFCMTTSYSGTCCNIGEAKSKLRPPPTSSEMQRT
jgi:hypothetical protein